MALSDLYIPVPKEYDDSDITGNPPIGVIAGTAESLVHSLQFGTTSELISMAHDAIEPGRALTKEDYEDSQWKRPGITFPTGVTESRAKRSADRYDANLAYQNTMSGISNGFLSFTSKAVGGTIGFTLDPFNMAAIGLAVASVGTLSEPLLAAAGEYGAVTAIGARFATNALVALSSMAPQAATDFAAGTIYGEDPSVLNAVSSLAINSGLGGLTGTVLSKPLWGALKRIIPSSDHFVALRSAVAQLEGGKKVNVDDILQNGVYQQGKIDLTTKAEFSPEEIAQNQADQRAAIIDDLESRKVEVNKLEGHEELKSQIDNQLDLLKKGEPFDDIKLDLPELPEELRRDKLTPKQLIDGDYNEARMRGAETEDEKLVRDSWNQLTDNAASVALSEANKGPVNLSQIKENESWLKSPESNNADDPQQRLQDEREIEETKENLQTGKLDDNEVQLKTDPEIDSLKNEVNNFAKELSPKIKEMADNINEIEENHNTIADAMMQYIKCIVGE